MPLVTPIRFALLQLGNLFVPRVCSACGAALKAQSPPLCAECGWELSGLVAGDYCRTCGEDPGLHMLINGQCTDCREGERYPRFEHFIRVGRYAGILQRLILRFKKEYVLDHLLGNLLAAAVIGRILPREIDYWVPIPSHWRRRLNRGFQPTLLLTNAAIKPWRGRTEPLLVATRHVRPFHQGVSPSQRREEIHGAFRVPRRMRLAGKRICIIDDVTTTGATLTEANRALRRAGATHVCAAVLAKVSHPPPILAAVDPVRRLP